MKKKSFRSLLSIVLTLAMLLTVCSGLSVSAQGGSAELTAFEQQFASPDSNDAKPYMRWWIAPGRMDEQITRDEIRNFAAGGYGGVELISLELATCEMNSDEWNEVMMWIFDEADKCGMKVDVTLGEFWPIATEMIPVEDRYTDPRAEQSISIGTVDFTAAEGSMTLQQDAWQFPPKGSGWWAPVLLNENEPWSLVAATVAKKTADGTYDPDSSVVITDLVDPETGAVTWTAPSEGDWTLFYTYQQATGKYLSYGVDSVVVDHLSKEASELIIQSFEDGFERNPALKELYKKAGGNFFGDSLELSSRTVWTTKMLEEFKARRGYDLTPYLPAIYSASGYSDAAGSFSYDFSEIGERVRMDFGQTISELLAENHLSVFRDWAHEELGMGLRYQVHTSASAFFFDMTVASLAVDIPETESYALGDSLDSYRMKSGVTHMKNSIYSAEAAESGRQDWRQTWTGSLTKAGSDSADRGFLHYTNRLFAAGVNKLVFHGTSSKIVNFEDTYFPGTSGSWPGYAFMGALNYSNEWDDKTPLWEHVNEMTDYLSRTQLVLQQGQGDMDLAYYRLFTTRTTGQAGLTDANAAGYTSDYISDAILAMDNAVAGEQNGKTVLAPDGPSYKAIVLDQRRSGDTVEPFAISLETAAKLIDYAKAGLPIVMIGEAPNTVDSYPGSVSEMEANDRQIQSMMAELAELPSVITIEEDSELVDALKANGIVPDANPDTAATNMFYHRTTDDAEFYFIANDSASETVSQTVTFQGEGKPYLLNAWSGEITPIAQYTAENGTVTVDVELAPADQMLIAIAKDGWCSASLENYAVSTNADAVVYSDQETLGVRTAETGEYTVTLADGQVLDFVAGAAEAPINLNDGREWTMVLHEWQPLTTATDTTDNNFLKTKVVDSETYTITSLVPWYEIDPEKLAKAGGVAEYRTTFELAEGWDEGQGAVISFDRVTDTMKLFVNGAEVAADQISKTVDIGKYLVKGENEIVVEVASNLANYKYGRSDSDTFQFGILGDVVVEPYRQTELPLPEEAVLSASAPESAQVNADFVVTVITAGSVADVKLYNEYDMAIGAKAAEATENEDGTKTWNLTVSAGTVGNRTFKVVTRGPESYYKDSGKAVSVEITSVAPVLVSFDLPDTAVANRTFIVKATTDMAATKINVYNEFGTKMGVKSLSYKVVDGQKVWTGVMSIGTKGERTFTATAVNKYGVQSEAAADSISVKAYA